MYDFQRDSRSRQLWELQHPIKAAFRRLGERYWIHALIMLIIALVIAGMNDPWVGP